MSDEAGKQVPSIGRSLALTIAGSTAFVAIILVLVLQSGLQAELVDLLEWIQTQGAWSALTFILIMALVVIALLPGVFLTTGAGFVFGIAAGTVYVVVGTTLGAAVAFLIARHLAGSRTRRFVLSHPRLHAISRQAEQHAFAVVLLTRLIPFFPGKLSNYAFGLAEFPFGSYVLASAVGFIPFSLHNVYLGSLAADLASLSAGTLQRTPWQWAIYGIGFAAIVVALIFVSRHARATLAQVEERESS
jgi:uncharacterized membrane protein YdjX (TVP38/TMEM64 family)